MHRSNLTRIGNTFVLLLLASSVHTLFAQPRAGGPRPPRVVSPETAANGAVTFRILAPQAQAVQLSGSDIPGLGRGAEMTKDPNGVVRLNWME